MKFPGYFLIVAEFIKWAKENGVPVGPGRGSGAGSLVAYSLLITDLDPLQYNLLFERFLNPERVSMPDFDIDFCQEGRDRVIQHVKDLYGKEAVSQIATFGTMAAKGAIRDVGRVLDFGYNFCDGISKLIPFKPGKPVTIADAIEEEPMLKERLENEEEVKQLLDLAQQVEGIARNIGMHAGGVLIAPGKLTDFCPLYTQGGDSGVVSQYDKDDVEAVGLVKFDFLGLTTLTILDRAVRYIKQLDPANADFALEKLPLNDKASYDLLTKAKTVAIFQLESRGMQGMLKDARPDRFEDIIALVALYRPGPMDLIPDFCKRKHGEKFDYPDPRTESILSETYGIMVYQEQVMQMAQIVGGYSLGGADMLRRAMGKKKAEEMAEHREIFRAGAAKDGLSTEKADEIFDLMEKFAGYGFNKSHAAAYALLSYHTAYLKAHHTAAFMAANLSLAMDDTDKIKILVEDCDRRLQPDAAAAGYQPLRLPLHAGRPAAVGHRQARHQHPLRPGRGQGLGPVGDRGDHRRAHQRRPVQGPVRLLQAGRPQADQPPHHRVADPRRRHGLLRRRPRDPAGVGRRSRSKWRTRRRPRPTRSACSAATTATWWRRPSTSRRRRGPTSRSCPRKRSRSASTCPGHMFDSYAGEVRRFARTKLADLDPSREPRMLCGVITGVRTADDPARQDPDRHARRQDRRWSK